MKPVVFIKVTKLVLSKCAGNRINNGLLQNVSAAVCLFVPKQLFRHKTKNETVALLSVIFISDFVLQVLIKYSKAWIGQ